MAAVVVFRLSADDNLITGSAATPYALTPYVLYRGMSVAQEYGYMYCKNDASQGADTAVVNPSHSLIQVDTGGSGYISSYLNTKVVRKSNSAVLIDYVTDNSGKGKTFDVSTNIVRFGPTLIEASMAVNEAYALYSKYTIGATLGLGVRRFNHVIGGS
jgi:hypothetical protein